MLMMIVGALIGSLVGLLCFPSVNYLIRPNGDWLDYDEFLLKHLSHLM